MGVTRELAPVLIRQLLHSYWLRATAGIVVPHHAIRPTGTAISFIRSCLPEGLNISFVLKEIVEQL